MKVRMDPAVYLKRRRLARDYVLHVPDNRVALNEFVTGDMDQFRQMEGLDALRCQTVACLAGWLWTLPEYRDYARTHHASICDLGTLNKWLGLGHGKYGADPCPYPFGARVESGMKGEDAPVSDKTIALRRLDALVAEAEQRDAQRWNEQHPEEGA